VGRGVLKILNVGCAAILPVLRRLGVAYDSCDGDASMVSIKVTEDDFCHDPRHPSKSVDPVSDPLSALGPFIQLLTRAQQ